MVSQHRSLVSVFGELYPLLRNSRATFAAALALLTIATLLKLVPPAATKFVIDFVLLDRPLSPGIPHSLLATLAPKERLVLCMIVVLVFAVLGTVVGLWSRWLAARLSEQVQTAVRRRVFEHAIRLPLHQVYQLKAGGATSLLRQDADSAGELVVSLFYNPWRALVQLTSGLLILAWVDWRLFLGSLCLAPCFYWSERTWHRWVQPLFRDVCRERERIDAQSAEVFSGIRVVRSFGRQRRETARFVNENNYLARQRLYAWCWSRLIEAVWNLLIPIGSAVLLLYGGLCVLDGRLSVGDLMMFLVYLAMLLEPLAILAASVTQVQGDLSSFDRVLDILAEPREMTSHPGTISVRKDSVLGRITLSDISFRYPNAKTRVLRDINLTIEPGEIIALVGQSGAGKTTLCHLIARVYDPTGGGIRLDGVDLRDLELEGYRRLLGIVEQDLFLFDGTIAENIAYANQKATDAEVKRAARIADADRFITSLTDGYETWIGERGVCLSGGQRQQLAVARAVLADPRIFILDEATSHLDSESERITQDSLNKLMRGRTSIVIAHRLSTIAKADRIVVLESGAIVETGTHAELMSIRGRYRKMVDLQHIGIVPDRPAPDAATRRGEE